MTGSTPCERHDRGSSGTARSTRSAELAAVEPDVRRAGLAHAPHDRLGHDVARREVGERVDAQHEAVARVVDEERALAAHRLGHQRLLAARARPQPEHGRVELHELQVGDRRRRRAAPARRRRRWRPRVGGLREDLAEAAGGQHDGAAPSAAPTPSALPSPMTCRVTPAAGPSASRSRSSASAFSMTSIAGSSRDRRDQRARRSRRRSRRRRRARCGREVAALAGQRQLAVRVVVEAGAALRSARARHRAPR